MRELNADRPDKTDCPFTVDAGHYQLEMDFVNGTLNQPNSQRGNVSSTAYDIAPLNAKVGLLNNLDFQMVFTPYTSERINDRDRKTSTGVSGFSGITPRFKLNLIGNDGGPFALALIPYVNLPLSTARRDESSVQGGLGIPYALDVPDWDIGMQFTVRYNHDQATPAYHSEFENSISVGHKLIGKLSAAGEFFSNVSTERGAEWIGTFDTWLTYSVNNNLRLDAGSYIGVTKAADDWHPWIGMTWRY